MNSKAYNIATAAAKVLSLVSGLASYNNYIPASVMPYAVGVFALASSLKEVVRVVRDWSDDGVVNNSIKD